MIGLLERYSEKIEEKMDNSTRKDDGLNGRTLVIILLVLLFSILISLLAQSDRAAAQGFATPTPLPAVQATLDAANAAQQSAQATIQQAAQMDAQAAEMRRNGIAQQQQAAQAISDARAASVAQNAAAIGEAIGRADANLSELSKTNAAQADMIATLTINQKVQAAEYISVTNEAQLLRAENQRLSSDKQTILTNYTALQSRYTEQQNNSTINPTIAVIAGLTGVFGIVGFVAWKWSRREPDAPPAPPAPPDPPMDSPWTQTAIDEDRAEDDSARMDDEHID